MIVAGFGFRADCTVDSLMDAYQRAGAPPVDAIATAYDKSQTTLFQKFAQSLNAPILGLAPHSLSAVETATASRASQTHRNTGSLAEASALAAIGEGAQLQSLRYISQDRMATCAIAQGAQT